MDLRSIRIDKVEEKNFNCPECSNISEIKYNVVINDDCQRIMCLKCHNKIALELSSNSHKKRVITDSLFKKMYGEEDNKSLDWRKFYY